MLTCSWARQVLAAHAQPVREQSPPAHTPPAEQRGAPDCWRAAVAERVPQGAGNGGAWALLVFEQVLRRNQNAQLCEYVSAIVWNVGVRWESKFNDGVVMSMSTSSPICKACKGPAGAFNAAEQAVQPRGASACAGAHTTAAAEVGGSHRGIRGRACCFAVSAVPTLHNHDALH